MSGVLHVGLIAQGGSNWAGGSEYIRNLCHAISAADPSQSRARVSVLCARRDLTVWRDMLGSIAAVVPVAARPERTWLDRRLRRGARELAGEIRAAGCEFVYPLTYDNEYNLGLRFPLTPALAGVRWAGWIPDFQHRHLPHFFTEKEIARRERGIAALVAEAPRIIFSSESAAEDFVRWYPVHGEKARVMQFATAPQPAWFQESEEIGDWVPERFLLVCNQFWKHKNHAVVFEALRHLAARDVRPLVLCTGRLHDFRDPDATDSLLLSLHQSGIAAQVLLVGMLPRALQMQLMRRALAVIQPSLFEGWSTVVEDARALGRPLLLSDLPVHREQAPAHASFFPPEAPTALADLMENAWKTFSPGPDENAEADARATAGERVRRFGAKFLELAEEARAA